MKLIVTWKNNAPDCNQRVYATETKTGKRKRIAEVAPGLEEVSIDLNTLPNGPIVWPAIITVCAVNGGGESKDRSAQYIFNSPIAMPGAFAEIMRAALRSRPETLPQPELVDTHTGSAKYDASRTHFMTGGYLFQNVAGKGTLFDPTLLQEVPLVDPYRIDTGTKEGLTILAADGNLYYIGTGYNNSETVWKWNGSTLTEVANLPNKTNLVYRHLFNGADGKIYCLGGYECVKNGRFYYAVFDPATNDLEIKTEESRNYTGNGASFTGAMDYNGIIVMVDTTYRHVVTIDTRTGEQHAGQLDSTTVLGSRNSRTAIGGDGVVYFAGPTKELTAVFLNTDAGQYSHMEVVTDFKDEEGYAECIAQAVTGELVIGFTKNGAVVFFDPITRTKRRMTIPGAIWVASIFRHDKGLTAATDSVIAHIDFAYQWSFDKSYEQSQIAATNYMPV